MMFAAGPFTVLVVMALLLALLLSCEVVATVTVFVSRPGAAGMTTMDTTAPAPDARSPTGQTTVPPIFVDPAVEWLGTNVTPGGSGLVKVTASAVLGPRLVMT